VRVNLTFRSVDKQYRLPLIQKRWDESVVYFDIPHKNKNNRGNCQLSDLMLEIKLVLF
jgi:predicted RNA-binding protein associated with RNAse of E/G family